MPKFKVNITIEVPAKSADEAHASIGDFMSSLKIKVGEQYYSVPYTIGDITPAWFVPPIEE
jgi:hypothetical protein